MAEHHNTTTSKPTASNMSTLISTLQTTFHHLKSKFITLLNQILPPKTRATIQQNVSTFANTHPLLASFLLSHVAISGLPIILFLLTSLTVTIFALLTGILLGVLGALLFIMFAVGFGLVVLLPTLFFTTFVAVTVWFWAVGAFYAVMWYSGGEMDVGWLREMLGLGRQKGEEGNGSVGEHRDDGKEDQGRGTGKKVQYGRKLNGESSGIEPALVNGSANAGNGVTSDGGGVIDVSP